jgi:hypothetical protein
VLVSIPVTLILLVRVVRTATERIQPAIKNEVTEEEPHLGEDS